MVVLSSIPTVRESGSRMKKKRNLVTCTFHFLNMQEGSMHSAFMQTLPLACLLVLNEPDIDSC